MKLFIKQLSSRNWTVDFVPISYLKILSQYKRRKSFEIYWSDKIYSLNAIVRLYYVSPDQIEIGDFWLNKEYRGKRDPKTNIKYSELFLEKALDIGKILFPFAKIYSLVVHRSNIAAIKLYQKIGFFESKSTIKIMLLTPKTSGMYMEISMV